MSLLSYSSSALGISYSMVAPLGTCTLTEMEMAP